MLPKRPGLCSVSCSLLLTVLLLLASLKPSWASLGLVLTAMGLGAAARGLLAAAAARKGVLGRAVRLVDRAGLLSSGSGV